MRIQTNLLNTGFLALMLVSSISVVILPGCSTTGSSGGGSRDGAPSDPPDLSSVPDAVPKAEPKSRYGNPDSYEVFGKRYYVLPASDGYAAKGHASWYGTKFHGRRTSSGEPYDMYKMTAAHKSLPIPTYARITNLDNGKEVIVKINDRGPFHDDRLVDLSYAAAHRLGVLSKGTARVHLEVLSPNSENAPTQIASVKTDSAPAGSTNFKPVSSSGTEVAGRSSNKPPVSSTSIAAANSAPATTVASATTQNKPHNRPNLDLKEVYLQLGAFNSHDSASALKTQVTNSTDLAVSIKEGKHPKTQDVIYKVQVGPLRSDAALEDANAKLSLFTKEKLLIVAN